MRLSELSGKTRSSSSSSGTTYADDTRVGSIRNAQSYTRPISALLHGAPVSLIAFGDVEGMSPAEKFIDENGRIDWASSDDFVVNDQTAVPRSTDQTQRLSQQLSQGRDRR